MFPLRSYRKMVTHKLKLKLHIVFEEQVSGALQVRRIVHCHSILILELEECLLSGSTQQFQGLDIFHTHVTDSGNNMQSSILTCTKNTIRELHQEVSLSASTVHVVSNWLLPLSMQTTDHEHWTMICIIECSLCSRVLQILNTVKLLIETDMFSLNDISSNKRQKHQSLSDIFCRVCWNAPHTQGTEACRKVNGNNYGLQCVT